MSDQATNQERILSLAKDGIVFNELLMLKMRLDTVTAVVVKHLGAEAAAEIDGLWESAMDQVLTEAEKQRTAAKLGLGGNVGQQLSIADVT